MPERRKDQAIADLKNRIHRSLRSENGDRIPEDADIERVLGELGSPAKCAAAIQESALASDSPEYAVWLGACAALAERLEVEPWVPRAVFVVTGLSGLGAPLALWAYLGLYFTFYYNRGDTWPRIRPWKAAKPAAIIAATAILLHVGAELALWFIYWAPAKLMDTPVMTVSPGWSWLEREMGGYCFWAFVTSVPLALIGGLPVKREWAATLYKCAQALLALYALAIAFGLASLIVGMILNLAQQFAGFDIIESVRQLTER